MLVCLRRSCRPMVLGAAVSLLLVLIPGISHAAGESEKLENTRKQIAQIRKKLEAAEGKEKAIALEVAALDKQISSLNRQIATGQHDVSKLESGMRTIEGQISQLEEKYRQATEASNNRARMLYKRGPAQALSRIFSAHSILEFVRLQLWFKVASEIDGKTMIDSARVKSDLQERKDDLGKIRNDLSLQRKWVEDRRDLVTGARADRSVALMSVRKEITDDKEDLKQLEADSRRLTGVISSSLSHSSGEIGAASRAGFIWPLRGAITSPFGPRHGGFHPGLDIDGNTGDPIRAAKSGHVAGISCGSGYGICTIIDHGGGVSTLYAHQSRKAVGSGQVSQGQVIGYVGCTGACTGSHLHFEVRVNGAPRSPRSFLP